MGKGEESNVYISLKTENTHMNSFLDILKTVTSTNEGQSKLYESGLQQNIYLKIFDNYG